MSKKILAQLQELKQDIEVKLDSSIIYAFSPSASVEELENGNYLITITDKNGTTTAQIPVVSKENIDYIINQYFQQNPIIQQYIHLHNISNQAHNDIRTLIQNAINQIPTKISDLQNDVNYILNFKDLIKKYPSYYNFPNIPPDDEKDMIFLDESTGDMFVFGLNDTLTYTSIGLSNQDSIYGGNSI